MNPQVTRHMKRNKQTRLRLSRDVLMCSCWAASAHLSRPISWHLARLFILSRLFILQVCFHHTFLSISNLVCGSTGNPDCCAVEFHQFFIRWCPETLFLDHTSFYDLQTTVAEKNVFCPETSPLKTLRYKLRMQSKQILSGAIYLLFCCL